MSSQREASDPAGWAGAEPSMLASDGDRDAVAGLLKEAFAEGRLNDDEHGERVRATYAARTWAELARLTADLPVPAGDMAARPAVMLAGVDRCLLCALLVLCPPAGIAWLLAARRRSRPGRGRPLALAGVPAWAGQPARWPAAEVPLPATGTAAGRVGYELETAVAARTGRRSPVGGGRHAEDR